MSWKCLYPYCLTLYLLPVLLSIIQNLSTLQYFLHNFYWLEVHTGPTSTGTALVGVKPDCYRDGNSYIVPSQLCIYCLLVAPCHCSGYFKVHAKFFQSPYILYNTLSPPNIWICCKNCVLLKCLDTHPGISCGSIIWFFLVLPYNVIIHWTEY